MAKMTKLDMGSSGEESYIPEIEPREIPLTDEERKKLAERRHSKMVRLTERNLPGQKIHIELRQAKRGQY